MAKDKRLTKAYESVDATRAYPLGEAIKLVKQNARAKFDETVEMSMNLGIDPRHADQMVRGLTSLPNGTGKTVRVGVFARVGVPAAVGAPPVVCAASSMARPPVLGCPAGWGLPGTRDAATEVLIAGGEAPPVSAWAAPPLAPPDAVAS